ncbi:MAG TPA: isocitrate/isopropylmalate family dehydrogenase, partial [Rugosimonospora sp.]|nr:isocitrate/isopropylmalate family dehydrogenase [Rugosimonospora sp.]
MTAVPAPDGRAAAPGLGAAARRSCAGGRRRYSVAVVAGDGIGTETVPVAQRVVDGIGSQYGFDVDWADYPWGSEYYRRHGRMMPADGLGQLAAHDAILFGAVGAPD